MGAFFGAVSTQDALEDVFYGTDYHSHLGTRRGGIAAYSSEIGLQREIHNIENSPFKTKFQNVCRDMKGNAAIGCISDYDPQPLLIRSKLGTFAIIVVGIINNSNNLIENYFNNNFGYFEALSGGVVNSTEIVASLINQKKSFKEGIKYAQSLIDGTANILILTDNGHIIAARDKNGRLPMLIGKNQFGYCVSFESFAYQKLGYEDYHELGSSEIVEISSDNVQILEQPVDNMQICSFLWTYYGYPTSHYANINVEVMRYKNGQIMAQNDRNNGFNFDIDYVCGVPDSGTPHAIGYANASGIPFARAFIKYTPSWARSFMPTFQSQRNTIAKMKLIPVPELIKNKKLLFVDDSIVRGTQLRETVDFLYENGAKEVHVRLACPPIMFGCKYLNFSRATSDMELIARRIMFKNEGNDSFDYINEYADPKSLRGKYLRDAIKQELHLSSIEFQTLDGLKSAIGLEPSKLCTYCWNGKEY